MMDILQAADGDIELSSGDIIMIEPTEQHKRDILLASQGDFGEFPLMGVGIEDYLNSEDNGSMLRQISLQMQHDGIKIRKVEFINGQLEIDGNYG